MQIPFFLNWSIVDLQYCATFRCTAKYSRRTGFRYTATWFCYIFLLYTHTHTHIYMYILVIVQSLSHVRLCHPMDCTTPGFAIFHHISGFSQIHIQWVRNAIEPSHSLPPPPPPPACNLSQHQGLSQSVGSSYQEAKVLELQHKSYQWIFRIDFL